MTKDFLLKQELLDTLTEIVQLNEDNYSEFGYNNKIGLYDAILIAPPTFVDGHVLGFKIDNQHFVVTMNSAQDEFLFTKINKSDYKSIKIRYTAEKIKTYPVPDNIKEKVKATALELIEKYINDNYDECIYERNGDLVIDVHFAIKGHKNKTK